MVKRLLLVTLALLLVPAGPRADFVQTADEVIEKHLAALGGRAALGKLTTRRATGAISVAVSSPTGDQLSLEGTIEALIKAPNKSRANISLDLTAVGGPGTMTIEQVFDGTTGWSLNSLQGETPIGGRQLAAMKSNVFPTPFLTYKETGTTVALQPRAKVDARDAIVLLVTPKTGAPITVYLDAETYLPLRTVSTTDAPDGSEMVQTVTFSDYRMVDGVQVAFKTDSQSPVQSASFVYDKIEHNVPIDDGLFKKGGQILRFNMN